MSRRPLPFPTPALAIGVAALLALPRVALAHTGDPARPPTNDLMPYMRADRVVMPSSLTLALMRARKIPSFARQTKLACSACHYQFPELTPFGRLFKLNGYTLTGLESIVGGDSAHISLQLSPIPPASAMVIASATTLSKAQPGTQNNTVTFPDQLSVFVGGQVTPKLGAFVQFTYAAPDNAIGIDNVDLRFANHGTIGKKPFTYGLTLHNNPTVQDLWNTVPAWSFPFITSPTAPAPTAASLIDGALGQQVLGLGAYSMWNNTLYTEITGYRSAPQGAAMPLDSTATGTTHRVIPYWRVALQHEWARTYAMIGTYGFSAQLFPSGVTGSTDRFTDIAGDAQVEQKVGAKGGVFIARTTYIHERQALTATFGEGGSANPANTLNTFRINGSYLPSTRYGLSLGYFDVSGTADEVLYSPAPTFGSANGSPKSNGEVAEFVYNPWQNTRLGAQYVWYNNFNGASSGYDGSGRSASNNNTLYLYMWLAF